MIKSFKHKGLEKFFLKGSKSGIQPKHADKLTDQLAFLNAAMDIHDMDKPGYRLHELTGQSKGTWAISVNGNWRLTFEFENGNTHIVDYKDYH